jgi:hypothetical protein
VEGPPLQTASGLYVWLDQHFLHLSFAHSPALADLQHCRDSPDATVTLAITQPPVLNHLLRCCHAGHEFVGSVVECSQQPGLVGQRVVGEINVNCAGFSCADAVFQRNHAPGRWVSLCHLMA